MAANSTSPSKEPAKEHPRPAFGWAATGASGLLSPFSFSRRATGEEDVYLKIYYCGICHSDLHFSTDGWGFSDYPLVPGHEIVGEVTEVGSKVEKFKVGDRVGVGCVVGACHDCDQCTQGLENYCPRMVLTYNAVYHDGTKTYGGYSDKIVVNERYAYRIPENLPMEAVAPLLCAGITVYSPLKYYGLGKPRARVGVVGLGGLGHLAVKFAKALGAMVTVISTSPSKQKEAVERLGADAFLVSRDAGQMEAAKGTLDGIIDTVSAKHSLMPLLDLLKVHGKLVMVGAPEEPLEITMFPILLGRKMVAGSCTGGTVETQEMLDFAGEHGVTADVEVIAMNHVNAAMQRMAKGDVRCRFVIDIANTLSPNQS